VAEASRVQTQAVTETPPDVAGGPRTMNVTATAYSLAGRTATGLPVGPGVVAVDPAVIPLGTRLSIPGYGEGVAADTGAAVSGDTIDLWFPTLADALAWGQRTVTVTLH
jgi:3D (Asp-Asp-Asp) domain-containing protein